LGYCREKDIEIYSQHKKFPIIPCNLCGSQEGLQRVAIKNMLAEWEKKFPDRTEIILTALKNVHPTHLLDRDLFDFTSVMKKEKI
jgi:tRNA 2-thiocytidine biosynthesis protein TtcA